MKLVHRLLAPGLLLLCGLAFGQGQETLIRKNLAERVPEMPKIEEITRTPMPGLYEIRLSNNDLYYSDAEGNFLINGQLIDTRQQRNLTEERETKLSAIDFNALPVKDAITIVRGGGKRKLAVFADPNCGYCKRFERDLAKVDNVTIYLFPYPVLGPNSIDKSRAIWCAKDKATAWVNTLLNDQTPSGGSCNTAAIDRNLAFGRTHKITGTPTLFAQNGTRVPGAISLPEIEKLLASANK